MGRPTDLLGGNLLKGLRHEYIRPENRPYSAEKGFPPLPRYADQEAQTP